jgi:hypothetical protein
MNESIELKQNMWKKCQVMMNKNEAKQNVVARRKGKEKTTSRITLICKQNVSQQNLCLEDKLKFNEGTFYFIVCER